MAVSVSESVFSSSVDFENMSMEDWFGFEHECKHELVEGVLIMTPPETYKNRRVLARLAVQIEALRGVEWAIDAGVVIDSGPQRPTVRVPDLIVTRVDSVGDVPQVSSDQVLLAVEVVSPGSRETDWVTKRHAYAGAGIPAYLVVDRHRGRLCLFDTIRDGHYARTQFDNPIVLELAGETLQVGLTDLLG